MLVLFGITTTSAEATVYGSFNVGGRIETEYLARGGPNVLGNPIQGEWDAARGGKFQVFQNNASIYWHPLVNNAFATTVGGAIRDSWADYGWENGPLMYPTTSEISLSKNNGRLNNFEGGSIYWSQATGAHPVWGNIKDQWQAQGWENGPLGYPTSGEYEMLGGVQQNFEGGTLSFNVGPEPDGDPNDTNALYGADDPYNKFANRFLMNAQDSETCSPADTLGRITCVSVGSGTANGPGGGGIDLTVPAPQEATPEQSEENAPTTGTPENSPGNSKPNITVTPSTDSSATPPTPAENTCLPTPSVSQTSSPTVVATTNNCEPPASKTPDTASTSSPVPTTMSPQNRPFPMQQQAVDPIPVLPDSVPELADPVRDLANEDAFFTASRPEFGSIGNWCVGKPVSQWGGKRYYACQTSRYTNTVWRYKYENGIPVGKTRVSQEKGFFYQDIITTKITQTANARVKFTRSAKNGTAGETTVTPNLNIQGSQGRTGTVTPSTSETKTTSSNPLFAYTLNMSLTPSSQKWEQDTLTGGMSIKTPGWTELTLPIDLKFPTIRCDSFTYVNAAPGCVIFNGRNGLPVMDLTTTDLWSPDYYAHILNAQNSGLPGNPVGLSLPWVIGRPLQRIHYKSQQALDNRAAACSTWKTGYNKPDSSFSCDEYPFASTAQGASAYPNLGRTWPWCSITRFPEYDGVVKPNGFSVCFIKDDQNRSGGRLLQPFNRDNRVLFQSDDPNDGFYVQTYY